MHKFVIDFYRSSRLIYSIASHHGYRVTYIGLFPPIPERRQMEVGGASASLPLSMHTAIED